MMPVPPLGIPASMPPVLLIVAIGFVPPDALTPPTGMGPYTVAMALVPPWPPLALMPPDPFPPTGRGPYMPPDPRNVEPPVIRTPYTGAPPLLRKVLFPPVALPPVLPGGVPPTPPEPPWGCGP